MRTKSMCVARGCDGCTVCQPTPHPILSEEELRSIERQMSFSQCYDPDRMALIQSHRALSAEVSLRTDAMAALMRQVVTLSEKLRVAQSALEWEERRCGRLHGPLAEALEKIRGGGA